MNKLIYLLFAVAIMFSACKKEEGCMEVIATNYNADAEEDDGSCIYDIIDRWTANSVIQDSNVVVTMMGIPIDSLSGSGSATMSPSELDLYAFEFLSNGTVYIYDTPTTIDDTSTWAIVGDSLLINGGSADTVNDGASLIYTVDKTSLTLIQSMSFSFSEPSMMLEMNATYNLTIGLSRDIGGIISHPTARKGTNNKSTIFIKRKPYSILDTQ